MDPFTSPSQFPSLWWRKEAMKGTGRQPSPFFCVGERKGTHTSPSEGCRLNPFTPFLLSGMITADSQSSVKRGRLHPFTSPSHFHPLEEQGSSLSKGSRTAPFTFLASLPGEWSDLCLPTVLSGANQNQSLHFSFALSIPLRKEGGHEGHMKEALASPDS